VSTVVRALVALSVVLVVAPSCTPPDHHPADYRLVFADEFNGTELDRDDWCTRYIYGGGATPQPDPECTRRGDGNLDFLNNEQQRYVDTNRLQEDMHVLRDGYLALRATKTRTDDGWASYESAMIRSKRLFRPTGDTTFFLTARVRMPDVKGTWPAFWLNSDRRDDGSTSWPPEIDILEGPLNEVEDRAEMLHQATIIRGAQTPSGGREFTFSAPDFDRRWNNYHADSSLRARWVEVSLEWSANEVCWFVDGYRTACERYHWVYNDGAEAAPAHVLLNLAIGDQWAGRHGIDDHEFPTSFDIDFVRVYQKG
jgi:beta-glucanase (GH16 family)